MRHRRKLKPRQLDPDVEAWHAAQHEQMLKKARRNMAVFDTLPPVVREAHANEPTGSISVSDVKGLAEKITRGELPSHIDHAHLAKHVIDCGTTVYRNFIKQTLKELEKNPIAYFRK
jgi:hypothetical protein